MYELLYHNYNIFLYGFGNKMKLIYDFIRYYQDKYENDSDIPYYIISCNLNNSEMSMKVILNKVENCIMREFENVFKIANSEKEFATRSKTYYEQIQKLKHIYKKISTKSQNIENENEDEDSSFSDKKDYLEEEKNLVKDNITNNFADINTNSNNINNHEDKMIIEKNENTKNKNEKKPQNQNKYLVFKILLIIHNIGSNIGRNKIFQENLSELNKQLKCINLVVTCENLTIPYYWTSEVKDKYQFCFVKFDTFLPYDNEIDEDTIKDEYDMTGGMALKEMFISFSEIQKRVIMEIAILQLKNEFDKLTPKGLIDYFINTGKGTVIDVQKLETILNDPIEHGIVTLKTCSINNKEIFRVNLDKSLCERIANGEFLLND